MKIKCVKSGEKKTEKKQESTIKKPTNRHIGQKLLKLIKYVQVKKLDLVLRYSLGEPSQTAISNGLIWGAIHIVLNTVLDHVPREKLIICIDPIFDGRNNYIYFECIICLNMVRMIKEKYVSSL